MVPGDGFGAQGLPNGSPKQHQNHKNASRRRFFSKTAHMRSAHACAVQTLFPARLYDPLSANMLSGRPSKKTHTKKASKITRNLLKMCLKWANWAPKWAPKWHSNHHFRVFCWRSAPEGVPGCHLGAFWEHLGRMLGYISWNLEQTCDIWGASLRRFLVQVLSGVLWMCMPFHLIH